MENRNYDFLILGSGLAGLSTALHASKYGSVGLVTKSKLNVSSSYYAQGGIAAVISEDDTIESHYNDTLIAGGGLCNKEAVQILVSDGSKRVKELIEMGMEFDKVNGKISLGLEGAHSHNRVLHADGDVTGKKVVEFLTSKVLQNKNIEIFENTFVFKLMVDKKVCNGFVGYNYLSETEICFSSVNTILASGGASAIYNRTTNPKSSTGDGIYLAYEAGAEIANMEFIQFHPSSLVTATDDTYLISEAVRGEGAYLINSANQRFMVEKHEKAELAPRDLVAYEIDKQWQIPNNKVYLTLSHLDAALVRKRFHNINLELKKNNLDIATSLIPVAPAAHYMIGGVKSGLNGETNIKGFYVAGEVASTGIHGANRLASNSLLECLVFSNRAVEHAKNSIGSEREVPRQIFNFKINNSLQDEFVKEKVKISKMIFEHVGIIRNNKDLQKFEKIVDKIKSNSKFEEYEFYSFQLNSILLIARIMTEAALIREESRGAHKRTDFTDSLLEYEIEIIHQKGKEFKLGKIN
ncbi:MAG: L-aspartate oxidase [Melioribacteraceae bacterium]|nr:L-aspartate oxidase [Melioribacteraceae bacterium]